MVLDTETTGLEPGQICQMSYIIFNQEFRIEKVFNKFYSVESVEKGASDVHGFTKEKLNILSDFKDFNDEIQECLNDFMKVDLIICHNTDFDLKFLEAEFQRLGIEFNFRCKSWCSMKYNTDILRLPGKCRDGNNYKYPRLNETMKYYGIDEEVTIELCKECFKCEEITFHDARFDVYGLYLICVEMEKLQRKIEADLERIDREETV
jgi:DNA polymerase III epsilon subunit-like protein